MARNAIDGPCACGSGDKFSDCCQASLDILRLPAECPAGESLITAWLERYSPPIRTAFFDKVDKYIFRISRYSDKVFDDYMALGFKANCSDIQSADMAIFSIKHNVMLSIFGSVSCLSQGLFIQSGTILRSAFEDCLVLIDIFENSGQIEKLLSQKYSATGLLSRAKPFIPPMVTAWYGYFSANFAHMGPFHAAPYRPGACFPDNYVLVVGLQNVVRAIMTAHVTFERIHFSEAKQPVFWSRRDDGGAIIFAEDNSVFTWARHMGEEIVSQYRPDERKPGMMYIEPGCEPK